MRKIAPIKAKPIAAKPSGTYRGPGVKTSTAKSLSRKTRVWTGK